MPDPESLTGAIAEHYLVDSAERRASERAAASAAFVPNPELEANLRRAETDPDAKAELERAYRGSWDLAWYVDRRAAAIVAGTFDPKHLKESQP